MHWTHEDEAGYRDDMFDLGRAVIHSVVNPLRSFTGAIHVYGGDFFGMPRSEWAPDTLEERPFDVERARRAYAPAKDRGNNDRCRMGTA
jgi:predicted metal-dependent enzyme (double-stranded beta helix superfamily)